MEVAMRASAGKVMDKEEMNHAEDQHEMYQ